MSLQRLIISLLLITLHWTMSAATYYVSPNGDDNASGTSESQAWRTIARVNQSTYSYQPGDVILLERGAIFREELIVGSHGAAGNPITVGAYGVGAEPIISGSEVITGWVLHSGGIWKTTVTGNVEQLFANGSLQTIARFPNQGWLRNDQGNFGQINDAELTQPNGYWNGATAIVRSSNWAYDEVVVSNYVTGQLNVTSLSGNVEDYEWGYYLCNKFSELDMEGEWFYNTATQELFFYPPNDQNPNNMVMEYPVRQKGVWLTRDYGLVENIKFQHHTHQSLFLDAVDHCIVRNCQFEKTHRGVFSVGNNNVTEYSQFFDVYATSLYLIDQNSVVRHCSFNNVAMTIGEGEKVGWGYFGLRVGGSNNHIHDNYLHTVGYIGMIIDGNSIVERNYIDNALALLNDGSGIAFDNVTDLTIRDNIIVNILGNIESSAPDFVSYEAIAYGIYFGNSNVQNTIVQNNTVANCSGGGIHVDHTMSSLNNEIRDNVLFNNHVQLSVSDFSNIHGPAAQQPYFVPAYNDVFSGNIMFSLNKDQYTLFQQQVNTADWSDWGTFENNYYFNPYEEQSIFVLDHANGIHKRYNLERWQADLNEDATSIATQQRKTKHEVTNELSSNMVPNGSFDGGVTGWQGWPLEAQLTHDYTYLDNGAMKVLFDNNASYDTFTHFHAPDFQVNTGSWYRARFSIQSDAIGEVWYGLKAASQVVGPQTIYNKYVPFGTDRRDVELIFQSDMSDQAHFQFTNHFTESTYWLDNLEVHEVEVVEADPLEDYQLLYNVLSVDQTFNLVGCWSDVYGNYHSGSVTITPFESMVLIRESDNNCGLTANAVNVDISAMLQGPYNPVSGTMNDGLRSNGQIPLTEPYTGMGYVHEGSGGEVTTTSVLAVTGNDAIVDWVFLELRDKTDNTVVRATRAALMQRDGDIVDTDGVSSVAFEIEADDYYISVQHRNHLSVISASTFALSQATTLIDFTNGSVSTYGTNAQNNDGGTYMLWPCDVTDDGVVKYTGGNNDRDPVLVTIGGSIPTASATGYLISDVNMDGTVKYTGANNDRDPILVIIGGSIPTAIRSEQMP